MNKKGFTLLEVVISILIFSICIAGATATMITAFGFFNSAKHRLEAYKQAQAVLEKLRYYPSSDPNNPSPIGVASVFSTGTHSPTEIGLGPNPTITGLQALPEWAYYVDTVSGSNCREVTVTVEWEES